jgi:hypothetical protein
MARVPSVEQARKRREKRKLYFLREITLLACEHDRIGRLPKPRREVPRHSGLAVENEHVRRPGMAAKPFPILGNGQQAKRLGRSHSKEVTSGALIARQSRRRPGRSSQKTEGTIAGALAEWMMSALPLF